MENEKINIKLIVDEVLRKLSENPAARGNMPPLKNTAVRRGTDGVFERMEDAIEAAYESQQELVRLSLEQRGRIIEAMRRAILDNVEKIAEMALTETGLGRYVDKVQKNLLATRKTPGIEDVEPEAFTGDHGLTLVEHAPYGVIGAITPSTNPSETVICNGIGMIAAGNSVVFNSHPGAKKVTRHVIQLLNQAIVSAGGPENLLCVIEEPDIETGKLLMTHPKIRLLVVTGGPEIVKVAMGSGKKVIAAGPGNPPVVVDDTADLDRAAKYIVEGASFDNNVLCIAEKEVFVVDCAADQLMASMVKYGAYRLSPAELDLLMPVIMTKNQKGEPVPNKKFVGKDVRHILNAAGIGVFDDIRLAVAEVSRNHPLVLMEQLMPVLPVVRVRDVDDAIEEAYKAEQGNYHTALMHSRNVDSLSKMARRMNTSIFVKNAPSYAGLGMSGEGFTTFTIASPTGEGLTSAVSFTRQRRCVLKDRFRIV